MDHRSENIQRFQKKWTYGPKIRSTALTWRYLLGPDVAVSPRAGPATLGLQHAVQSITDQGGDV